MQFDYVIIGGGSAGATLAARLSECGGHQVCLLEAGGSGNGLLVKTPIGVAAMLPGKPVKVNNWAWQTVPQSGLNGRRGYQPRGKALGGSSAINAMLYVRGQQQDYDHWAEMGCDGWSWGEVLPYFKLSENNERGVDLWHGNSGSLHVSDQHKPRPITNAFIKASIAHGIPHTDDFNKGDNYGVGLYQVTQFHDSKRRGERCSSALGYLHPVMTRANLTVVTRAQVNKILFEDNKAIGVSYRREGKDHEVLVAKEVVLAAGALASPQLLQLSGVGRKPDLEALGIPVIHDSPEVGYNLQDHLDFILSFKSKTKDMFGFTPGIAGKMLGEAIRYKQSGEGMMASPMAEAGSFFKTTPELDRPDVQSHFVIGIVDDHVRKLHYGYGYSCHVCMLRPYSRGRIYLQSNDVTDAPQIDPQYLADERDLKTMVSAAQLLRQVMYAPQMDAYRGEELFMQGEVSDEEMAEHIRNRADTIYHPVGTCRMGIDENAVVDPQLRVKGVQNLRVVDASIMPTLISGNTNAATIMIAEKAAHMMLTN